MANKNFVVKNGLTVGSFTVDANSGNISTPGSVTVNELRTDTILNSTGQPLSVIGYTGSAGQDGTIGVDGYTGSIGYTGSSGSLGYTGSAGPSGLASFTTSNTAPVSPELGDKWYNTSRDVILEYINDGVSSFWLDVTSPQYDFGQSAADYAYSQTIGGAPTSINLLMAAGGGGSGGNWPAGAGAGGLILRNNESIAADTTYTITIGAGATTRANGNDTTFLGLTAIGGGAASDDYDSPSTGGSGGGKSMGSSGSGAAALQPGSASGGYGHAGGGSYYIRNSGGGGGAGSAGVGDFNNTIGGNGIQSDISGTDEWYCGAGRGWGSSSSPTKINGNGWDNYGGGGGYERLAGMDGVVIIQTNETERIATTTGNPTISLANGKRIYKFTSSGSIIF